MNKKHTRRNKPLKTIIIKSTTPAYARLTPTHTNRCATRKGRGYKKESYRPSVNEYLVTLETLPHEVIADCNNVQAFNSHAPLQISVPNEHQQKCVPYYDSDAKKVLLQHLRANKHIVPSQIIPPQQLQGNCWFNTMFVSLFVSDKGRIFFHFFRQLMIEGKQADGQEIPEKLRNALAIFNFAIEACLSGSHYAYELDTNTIIKQIYDVIGHHQDIEKVDDAGNPLFYYKALISFLGNAPLTMMHSVAENDGWRKQLDTQFSANGKKPHVIALEVYKPITDKQMEINFADGSRYILDSAIIRDTSSQHFCAAIMCEGKEMAFDGASFHRLTPFKWKKLLNLPQTWSFAGSYDDEELFKWSFVANYCLLFYYRT